MRKCPACEREQLVDKRTAIVNRIKPALLRLGIETADMLTHEVFSRILRDGRAVARYSGLTGSPDESSRRRPEKGLAKAGNARMRRDMIQFARRFLFRQRASALAQWYQATVAGSGSSQAPGSSSALVIQHKEDLREKLYELHGMMLRDGIEPIEANRLMVETTLELYLQPYPERLRILPSRVSPVSAITADALRRQSGCCKASSPTMQEI
jgi:hypothetical protein